MSDMDGRPLGEVLVRIGVELSEAAVSVEDLHALVEATVTNGGTTDIFMRQAQTIDILQQHLAALADFLCQLSDAIPPSWRIESEDTMSNVKLSRLRDRLSQMCAAETSDQHASGDLDMF
jgi:hypothetical protein